MSFAIRKSNCLQTQFECMEKLIAGRVAKYDPQLAPLIKKIEEEGLNILKRYPKLQQHYAKGLAEIRVAVQENIPPFPKMLSDIAFMKNHVLAIQKFLLPAVLNWEGVTNPLEGIAQETPKEWIEILQQKKIISKYAASQLTESYDKYSNTEHVGIFTSELIRRLSNEKFSYAKMVMDSQKPEERRLDLLITEYAATRQYSTALQLTLQCHEEVKLSRNLCSVIYYKMTNGEKLDHYFSSLALSIPEFANRNEALGYVVDRLLKDKLPVAAYYYLREMSNAPDDGYYLAKISRFVESLIASGKESIVERMSKDPRIGKEGQEQIILSIPYSYVQKGDIEKGIQKALALSNETQRNDALGGIVNWLIQYHYLKQAQTTLALISDPIKRSRLMERLVLQLIKAKKFDDAENLVWQIPRLDGDASQQATSARNFAFIHITDALIREMECQNQEISEQQLIRIENLIKEVQTEGDKRNFIGSLGSIYLDKGNWEKAAQLTLYLSPDFRSIPLVPIGFYLANAGKVREAIQLAKNQTQGCQNHFLKEMFSKDAFKKKLATEESLCAEIFDLPNVNLSILQESALHISVIQKFIFAGARFTPLEKARYSQYKIHHTERPQIHKFFEIQSRALRELTPSLHAALQDSLHSFPKVLVALTIDYISHLDWRALQARCKAIQAASDDR